MTRAEAKAQLENQISKGRELAQVTINTEASLSQAQADYYTWSEYNEEMLRSLFDSDDVRDNYVGIVFAMGSPASIRERAQEHVTHVESKIRKLESIKDRLPLWEEAATVKADAVIPRSTTAAAKRVFISHGRSEDWRQVQAYLEKDLNFQTLELAQAPNLGRTVLQKLWEESGKCSLAVIIMTGDDTSVEDVPRARENVIHEIGFFQGRFGLAGVCLLHEEGTNIPSNIHGLVYIAYAKSNIRATFGELYRELKAFFDN
ncbi:MAG: TIR domain-containing protein [Blastocatellia bacterium]